MCYKHAVFPRGYFDTSRSPLSTYETYFFPDLLWVFLVFLALVFLDGKTTKQNGNDLPYYAVHSSVPFHCISLSWLRGHTPIAVLFSLSLPSLALLSLSLLPAARVVALSRQAARLIEF